MATYGIDYYGRSKYGTATGVEYSAAPFVAHEYQYGRLILTWASPLGNWTLFRLLKNLSGPAADENDGELLINTNKDVDGAPATQYDDLNCVPGRFYYYSIFVGVGSDPNTATWWRAGNALNIAVANLGWTDRFWGWIPRIFQRGDDSTVITDTLTDENETLKRFLDIFGYQMNVLGTSGYALNQVNNVGDVSFQAIPALGAQFGVDIEPELGPRIGRTMVANATYLNQNKGTQVGLEGLISATTGWDADIEIGHNLMLDADQSSFVNPTYPQWNGAINYTVGERVVYNSNIYQSALASYNTPPPTTRTSSASWTYVGDSVNSIENPITRGQFTWGAQYPNSSWSAADPAQNHIRTSVGFQSVSDPNVYASNSLILTNKSGATSDVTAWSVSPISSTTWSSVVTYVENNYVTHNSLLYRSNKNGNLNKTPATNPDWWVQETRITNSLIDPQQIITDGIPIAPEDQGQKFTASAYVMTRGIVGTGTPSVAHMSIQWYDAYGNAIGYANSETAIGAIDKFLDGGVESALNAAPFTDSAYTWAAQTAIKRSGTGYVYRATSTPGYYLAAFSPTYGANCQLAVTVRHFPAVGGSAANGCGLFFRWSDNNNYFRLRKDKLERVQAGVVTTLIDLTTVTGGAFTDGDRMGIRISGTNISVLKNLSTIWNGTDAFNQTQVTHGIWVGY